MPLSFFIPWITNPLTHPGAGGGGLYSPSQQNVSFVNLTLCNQSSELHPEVEKAQAPISHAMTSAVTF